jgi:hypothetical protein
MGFGREEHTEVTVAVLTVYVADSVFCETPMHAHAEVTREAAKV